MTWLTGIIGWLVTISIIYGTWFLFYKLLIKKLFNNYVSFPIYNEAIKGVKSELFLLKTENKIILNEIDTMRQEVKEFLERNGERIITART